MSDPQQKDLESSDGYTKVPNNETSIKTEAVLAQPLDNQVPAGLGNVLPQAVLDDEREVDIEDDRFKDKGELSLRAIIIGGLIGSLVSAMNVNFGLRTGWTQGGSIFASILSIGIFKVLNPVQVFTKYETVIAATTASSCGIMASTAGLVSSMPALKMLGQTFSVWEHYLWAIAVAFFGIYFATMIRHQMLVKEKMRFPSGTAAAETIKAMYAHGSDTVEKAKSLVITGAIAGIYALVSFFLPIFQQPPVPEPFSTYGFRIYANPLLIGGGMLSGFRATFSMLAGAIVGWGILAPISKAYNWTLKPEVMSFLGPRGWILWVGVAVMTADSMIQLLWTLKYVFSGMKALFIRVKQAVKKNTEEDDEFLDRSRAVDTSIPKQSVPMWWIVAGMCLSTVVLLLVGHLIFSINFWFILLAIPLSMLLSIIAARSSGETDINPVGGMGKVTQLVYAGVAQGEIRTNLLAAAIVAAGASQCGDTMQDFKNGYLVRVSPKKQFVAQCLGVMFGIIVCVPIYKLYDMAYVIGQEDVPAPAAHAWKAVAEILAKGLSALPLYSGWGILAGALFGAGVALAGKLLDCVKQGYGYYLPSALAFGIGFIVPPKQSIAMFAGALIHFFWKKISPKTEEQFYFTISSGMIAGEGLMGVVIALLKLIGLKPLFTV